MHVILFFNTSFLFHINDLKYSKFYKYTLLHFQTKNLIFLYQNLLYYNMTIIK